MPPSPGAVQHCLRGRCECNRAYGCSTAASAAVRRTSVADVIEDKRTARERARPRAGDDLIVRLINVISVAARARRGMRLANASIASVMRTPGGPRPKIK